MTRTWWMSSRRGMGSAPSQQGGEAVEEAGRVVRTGRGLGVVLDAEGRDDLAGQALDGAVVGARMAQVDGAERRVDARPGLAGDGESVVLAGDRDGAVGVVDHGDVDPAVAVAQLVGPQPERAG